MKTEVSISLVIVGAVVVLSLLSKWSQKNTLYDKQYMKKIRMMIDQSHRWNSMARQDNNALIQLIHCDYALAYIQAARNLSTDQDIQTITGVDALELQEHLMQCQQAAIDNIGQQAPNLKMDGNFTISGWI